MWVRDENLDPRMHYREALSNASLVSCEFYWVNVGLLIYLLLARSDRVSKRNKCVSNE